MRASRETELMREYGLATACKWIGNSPRVAAIHYDMSIDIDADYRRAAGRKDVSKAQEKAQETASAEPCRRETAATSRS